MKFDEFLNDGLDEELAVFAAEEERKHELKMKLLKVENGNWKVEQPSSGHETMLPRPGLEGVEKIESITLDFQGKKIDYALSAMLENAGYFPTISLASGKYITAQFVPGLVRESERLGTLEKDIMDDRFLMKKFFLHYGSVAMFSYSGAKVVPLSTLGMQKLVKMQPFFEAHALKKFPQRIWESGSAWNITSLPPTG